MEAGPPLMPLFVWFGDLEPICETAALFD